MQLPRPNHKRENEFTYSRRLARAMIPKEAANRKSKHRINPKQGQNSRTVVFSLTGECKGSMAAITDLAAKLVEEALAKGDTEYARRVLTRLTNLQQERELARLQRQLEKCQ